MRWLRDTRHGKRLAGAAQRWWRALLTRWRRRAMLERCVAKFPVTRGKATRRRLDESWAAWRAAFAASRRQDRLNASRAASAARDLLQLLAAKRQAARGGASSSSSSSSDEEERIEVPMSPRKCITCGGVGRVPMAAAECLDCVEARTRSQMRLELRRRGLAAVKGQRIIRGVLARAYVMNLRAARDRLRAQLWLARAQRTVAAVWRGSRARAALVHRRRATLVLQCAARCCQAKILRKRKFDAWYEGLLKLGDQMFEELADWPGPDPERLPDGSWPPPPGVPPREELAESDDPWDQLMCIVLKGVTQGDPAKDHIPTQEEWDQMEKDGEDPAAVAVLQFILQQTPPPPGCLDVPRLLKILRENLPKRELKLPPPPQIPVEYDYPPEHPLRDESEEAERKRRTPPPKPPLSEVEKFLERWYEDHPDCERIEIPECSIWNTELQKPGAFRTPPPPPRGAEESKKGS